MTIAKEQPLRQRIVRPPGTMVREVLLACGILAPLLYVATDILTAMLYEGYSYTDQTISELFAIGAPTRPLVLVLAPAYALLVYAFGAGLWTSAGEKRALLRVVAAGLVGKEILGLVVTLLFPMHMRGVEGTLTDTMHATLTLIGNLLFLLAIGFGATVFGKRFRLYSIATIVLIVVGGVLAGLDAPQMAADLPTPWMGLWERMDAYAYVLWMAVLAIALLRTRLGWPKGGLRGRGHPMKTIKAFVERHPLLSYFALAFAISWAGILLVVGGPGGILGTEEEVDRLLLFVMMAWFAGPSVASIMLTGLLYGRAGFRDLLARMRRWRVGARWYALALLLAPFLFAAVSLALSLISLAFLPGILAATDKAALLLFGIGYGLIGGGLLEELGWTGFATPRMRLCHGIVGTGLIVGVLWGAYHFSVMLWMSSAFSGGLPLAIFLPVQMFAWLPAYRVLMVWVYDRTGESLLLAMLMHASLSASMLILQPLAIAGVSLLSYILVFAAVLWIVVGAVAWANHGQLSRQPTLRRRVA